MKPIYLMFTGLSLSGKTWLFNKIQEKFPNVFFPLDSRSIHDYLNQFEVFQDDMSVDGRAYKMRQEATDTFQKDIVSVIAQNGYSIAHDSCNRVKKDREERLNLVKKLSPGIKTALLYVNPPRKSVLESAKREDAGLIAKGRDGVWVNLYNKQIETYEQPDINEADHFFEFDGSNEKDVLKFLGNILNEVV